MNDQAEKSHLNPSSVAIKYYQLEQNEPQDYESFASLDQPKRSFSATRAFYPIAMIFFIISAYVLVNLNKTPTLPTESFAWSSKAAPFSIVDPTKLGIMPVERPMHTRPGKVFGKFLNGDIPLPTNEWYENFVLGQSNTNPENKVFEVPYILDTAGGIPGIRTHACHIQAANKSVEMTYELMNGLTLGAMEKFDKQFLVRNISQLAVELEWDSEEYKKTGKGTRMETPVVRGSPYITMKYFDASPRVLVERQLSAPIIIDNQENSKKGLYRCDLNKGNFTFPPFMVQKELKMQFDTSDMTWLLFVSDPTEFVCSTGADYFELRAVKPMTRGMVRIAMANNCTTGQNPQHCTNAKPSNQTKYEKLLRNHYNVYPTVRANIEFTFPVQSSVEEELSLLFKWHPALMSEFGSTPAGGNTQTPPDIDSTDPNSGLRLPEVELLMFAMPHHQERMQEVVGSSNRILSEGCFRTLHGFACPALGAQWSLLEHLHRTEFMARRTPKKEMIPSIQQALQHDIHFQIPLNYQRGAGDTYFSGKILAKLGRILLVAEEVGGVSKEDFHNALGRLRSGVEVWLNGSAESPFMYDRAWGGLIMCGCNYTEGVNKNDDHCVNKYPDDCPALTDFGQNFGAGYYNDHHYHYGYHIYAAAVLAKFDPIWARKYHQHVLLLIRDIANPSMDDPFFPLWRHKDWYSGHSWASGIVTIEGKPYPNGRNQESISEAISAYEAVALYGKAMVNIFDGSTDPDDGPLLDNALRIQDMGRLLMATEIRSGRTYWQVRHPGAKGVSRIYPDVYKPKVVGMVWSMLIQEQTWFGNEEWKSYGIQLMPITAATELRDSTEWLREMLPEYSKSCSGNEDCLTGGWNVLMYTTLAAIGNWTEAWRLTETTPLTAYDLPGGNGHSKSNTLWFIATRPDPSAPVKEDVYNSGF